MNTVKSLAPGASLCQYGTYTLERLRKLDPVHVKIHVVCKSSSLGSERFWVKLDRPINGFESKVLTGSVDNDLVHTFHGLNDGDKVEFTVDHIADHV